MVRVILGKMHNDITNIFGIFVGVIAVIVTIYFQFQDPMTGIIWVVGILGFIALYFIVSYPIMFIRKVFNQTKINSISINNLRKDLNNLKDNFDLRGEVADLKAKMDLLELLISKKKGQVDPRWVIIIIIVILLLFYLRSKGII